MENTKFWQEFFQIYKNLPALWRVRSTEYSDRVLKSSCYLKLIRKLKEIHPDADREMVVRKINNFRTSYRKELRKIRESKQTGKIHRPTLWYFDFLTFLEDQDDGGREKSISGDENTQEKKQNSSGMDINTTNTNEKLSTKRYSEFKDNEYEEVLPTTSKRKKFNHIYSKNEFRKLSYEDQQQVKIDADILAKSWAVQYKEMQGNQKIIARKLISDILYYGCLGTLSTSHGIELQDILLKEMRNAPEPQSPIESNYSFHFAKQDYVNYDSFRELPLEMNNCSSPLSPSTNSINDFQVKDIKFEVL